MNAVLVLRRARMQLISFLRRDEACLCLFRRGIIDSFQCRVWRHCQLRQFRRSTRDHEIRVVYRLLILVTIPTSRIEWRYHFLLWSDDCAWNTSLEHVKLLLRSLLFPLFKWLCRERWHAAGGSTMLLTGDACRRHSCRNFLFAFTRRQSLTSTLKSKLGLLTNYTEAVVYCALIYYLPWPLTVETFFNVRLQIFYFVVAILLYHFKVERQLRLQILQLLRLSLLFTFCRLLADRSLLTDSAV